MSRVMSVFARHPRLSAATAGVIAATGTAIGFVMTSGAASACCAWAH